MRSGQLGLLLQACAAGFADDELACEQNVAGRHVRRRDALKHRTERRRADVLAGLAQGFGDALIDGERQPDITSYAMRLSIEWPAKFKVFSELASPISGTGAASVSTDSPDSS